MKKRILGIDYGTKRVGVAVSDENRQFALPVAVIANSPDLVSQIKKIAADNGLSAIVMGESRDYKNQPNAVQKDIEKLKSELEKQGFEVILEPEFMTSAQAERLQGKNDKIDASAAALILQSYLEKINK